MGFLTKLFGQEGTVRFKATTEKGNSIEGTMKVELFNIGVTELENEIKNSIYVQTGKRFKTMKVLGFTEGI